LVIEAYIDVIVTIKRNDKSKCGSSNLNASIRERMAVRVPAAVVVGGYPRRH
jgi:hypothetical protein